MWRERMAWRQLLLSGPSKTHALALIVNAAWLEKHRTERRLVRLLHGLRFIAGPALERRRALQQRDFAVRNGRCLRIGHDLPGSHEAPATTVRCAENA